MKTEGGTTEQKRVAGESAAALVEDGMTVGLGTGSTAAHAVRAIGEAVADGLDVRGVPTSLATRALAREAGVPLVELEDVDRVDLAIDGADQVANGDLVKGGGGAHAREKVVAGMAERFVVVVDPSKLADRLDRAVPVAVLPDARTAVAGRLRDLGGDPSLRDAARKDGPVVTDDGHLLLDAEFGTVDDPAGLASDLAAIPGVVEHGLFVDMADEVHVGRPDGATVDRR
jgi:ribose 5-phosphate isomerase A